jgi:hypothetical protein
MSDEKDFDRNADVKDLSIEDKINITRSALKNLSAQIFQSELDLLVNGGNETSVANILKQDKFLREARERLIVKLQELENERAR